MTGARAAADDSPPAATSVPFLFDDARIYVPVRIAGEAPRWFILDTGATRTIIDSAAARSAHLDVRDLRAVHGAGAGATLQGEADPVQLQVGGVPLRVARPAIMDLAHLLGPTSGRAPAGIIGSQFFREHFVDIDFAKRTLTVCDPGAAASATYAAHVPLTFADWTPLAKVNLTLPGGRTVTANALVDLGAKATFLIAEPFIARERLATAFPHIVTTGFGAGVGGDTFYAFARAQRLSMADAPALGLDRPVVGLSVGGTLRSAWHDGLLGADFLSRFRVGFDYAGGRLLLTPQANPPARFDRSGLFIVAEGEGLNEVVVRQVLEDSPAARAGLAPGDRILALDGAPAATLLLDGMRSRLKDETRDSVDVRYQRGGKEGSARLRLHDLL